MPVYDGSLRPSQLENDVRLETLGVSLDYVIVSLLLDYLRREKKYHAVKTQSLRMRSIKTRTSYKGRTLNILLIGIGLARARYKKRHH
jgi:hypothetical protein